ncbi:centromere protein M isoform X9 [Prionailurus viverrinus]|uniref:centromere protein M isoform X9 n=1 Tax=Prionailurus viverrinus TaxID=61388 RepID=UPI001FF1D0BB|nr:centromere protein M isoform X9 [Prionailurus viverrinus]
MVFPASLGSGLPKQSLGQLRSAVQTVLERVHSEPSTGAWRSPLSLVGTEDALLQQLADSMLKEDCASELRVHLARSLPLPSSVDRPRIDLIVFVVNLHSKYSLRNVEESLHHVDATFFLGKAAFLATGAGRESHCSVHRNTIVKLAHTYRSPLFFCDLEIEGFRATMAQRLVRMLQICAGHVPGVSALNLLSLLRSSETPAPEDL